MKILHIATFVLAVSATATALADPAATPPAASGAVPRPMTAVDLLDLRRPGVPRLSPDGRRALFPMARADWQRNRALTDLWLVDLDGGMPRRMIADGGSGATWAPDGRRFAFAARRGDDKVRQIYLMPADGGEAVRLTRSATSAAGVAWPGDGRFLYFLADQLDDKATTARLKTRDDMLPFESPRRRRALWRADADSGQQRIVAAGDFDIGAYDVARDGRTVLYRRSPSRLLDDKPQSELWLLEQGRPPRQLTDNDYQEASPRLSPDARSALFLANAEHGRYGTVNTNLFVLDIASGRVCELQHGLGWKIENAEWSGDGREIVFSATTGVRRELFAVNVARDRLRPIARGDFAVSGFSQDAAGRTLVYAAASATDPGEIYRTSLRRPATTAVTRINDGIGKRFRLPRQQAIQWTAADGQQLEGLLTYPLDYVPGKRYPLIVQSHGGPRSSDVFNIFAYGRFNPLLAAHGFMSLSVNYRGGTGYGDAFLQDMNAGYFRHADKDVLSGVDHAIALGLADPQRLGAMGWSAGGHMTNRLITVTDRFKAAASGAGAVDWPSMYLTSDTRWQRREWFVTPPYGSTARHDLYAQHSPLGRLDKVRTPTLILAGREDRRVPWAQSVMLYRALKALGVETVLYLAPREPHNFTELRHRLFQINVQMDWFSRRVAGIDYTWAKAPGQPQPDTAPVEPGIPAD